MLIFFYLFANVVLSKHLSVYALPGQHGSARNKSSRLLISLLNVHATFPVSLEARLGRHESYHQTLGVGGWGLKHLSYESAKKHGVPFICAVREAIPAKDNHQDALLLSNQQIAKSVKQSTNYLLPYVLAQMVSGQEE